MVNQERQSTNRDDQELHSERVVVPIISRLELQVDEVHSGVRTPNVDDLEDTHDTVQNMKDEDSLCVLVCHEWNRPATTQVCYIFPRQHYPLANTGVSTWFIS